VTPVAASRPRRTRWQQAGYLARRAVMMEIHGYLSIYRFIFRRPRVPAGATGFPYHQPVLTVLIAFVVLSAVELVAVDFIVRRWPPVRIPLLILGIWGLVYMFGLLFGMLTRPHAVGPDGIRVRQGSEIDIKLTWDEIVAVSRRTDIAQQKPPKVTVGPDGTATLHLRMQSETNLEITLDRPTELRLPHGAETVTAVALYADDPQGFLAAVRRHMLPGQ
jgi:hypothetical protein